MKKLFLIIFMLFFMVSCQWNFGKLKNTLDNSFSGSNGIVELDNQSGSELNESSENTGWNLDENWNELNLDSIAKILTIEEQYCKSKWWKVTSIDNKNICYITDEIGLLKCEVSVFYQDKCRTKSIINKNWIIIGFIWQTKTPNIGDIKMIENKNNTVIRKVETSLQADNKKILEKQWEVKQNMQEVLKEDTLVEEKTLTEVKTLPNIKALTEIKTWNISKLKIWKSGTYYISGWDLKMETASWGIKTLVSAMDFWTGEVDLFDFVLLTNKQIKVLYYTWADKKQEEKIIDLK